MPWQGLGSGQQHVLLSSRLLEGLERSALDSIGKSVRWAHRRCQEQTSGQGTQNRWHGRGICWHRRREACSLPERGPRCSWAPWLRHLDSLPRPSLFICKMGITMVLSSSTSRWEGGMRWQIWRASPVHRMLQARRSFIITWKRNNTLSGLFQRVKQMKVFQHFGHSRRSVAPSVASAATPWSAGGPPGGCTPPHRLVFSTTVTGGQNPWCPPAMPFEKDICTEQWGRCRKVSLGLPQGGPAKRCWAHWWPVVLPPHAPALSLTDDPRLCLSAVAPKQHPPPSLPLPSVPPKARILPPAQSHPTIHAPLHQLLLSRHPLTPAPQHQQVTHPHLCLLHTLERCSPHFPLPVPSLSSIPSLNKSPCPLLSLTASGKLCEFLKQANERKPGFYLLKQPLGSLWQRRSPSFEKVPCPLDQVTPGFPPFSPATSLLGRLFFPADNSWTLFSPEISPQHRLTCPDAPFISTCVSHRNLQLNRLKPELTSTQTARPLHLGHGHLHTLCQISPKLQHNPAPNQLTFTSCQLLSPIPSSPSSRRQLGTPNPPPLGSLSCHSRSHERLTCSSPPLCHAGPKAKGANRQVKDQGQPPEVFYPPWTQHKAFKNEPLSTVLVSEGCQQSMTNWLA